ncbi:MAG: ATP-binding cassette domain-containing protein [Actinomycetota bacterium]|nr:ATP-binding cassette domain-containing protein [Actinomycetota bacterium]
MLAKALELNKLSVTLGNKRVLEDITFSIDQGDFLIIIGPNGSGKTTLIKAVMNLVPHTGQIKIFGKPAPNINSYRGIVGYVPQKFEFDRTFPITVKEVIAMAVDSKNRQLWPGR